MKPFPAIIPDDLRERDQWVLWRYESRSGATAKVPNQPGKLRASSTDPRSWSSLAAVERELLCNPGWYEGPGFVFSASDPFCGIDLDDCLDAAGNVKVWAQGIVGQLTDSYTEVSPSGTGLKIG